MLYGLSSRAFGSKSFPTCIKPFILKKISEHKQCTCTFRRSLIIEKGEHHFATFVLYVDYMLYVVYVIVLMYLYVCIHIYIINAYTWHLEYTLL